MLGFMIVFLCLVAIFTTLPSFLLMRNRFRGAVLVLLAPVPGALLVGVFAAIYLSRIESDSILDYHLWGPILYWSVPLMLAAWLLGLFLCVIWVVVRRSIRSMAGKGTPS